MQDSRNVYEVVTGYDELVAVRRTLDVIRENDPKPSTTTEALETLEAQTLGRIKVALEALDTEDFEDVLYDLSRDATCGGGWADVDSELRALIA